MAQVLGTIDSLQSLQTELIREGIEDLESMQAIVSFENQLPQRLAKTDEEALEEIKSDIGQYLRLIEMIHFKSHTEVENSKDILKFIKRKITVLVENIEEEVEWRSDCKSLELFRRIQALEENYTTLTGAKGEQQVADVLNDLPTEYSVINGLRLQFDHPYYNRMTGQSISSVQVDHVVVGPTGVFLIETKNWRKASGEIVDWKVQQQIERTGYAMYRHINNHLNGIKNSTRGEWERRVCMRNILVPTGVWINIQSNLIAVQRPPQLNQFVMSGYCSLGTETIREIIQCLKPVVEV